MVKLAVMETLPFYAQVAIIDPEVPGSYPDWGSGESEVAVTPSGIAVETRPDRDGVVVVEVWAGIVDDRTELRELVRTTITIQGASGLLMGSVTGNDLRRVVMPAGTYNVNVLVGGEPGVVDRVAFEFPDI